MSTITVKAAITGVVAVRQQISGVVTAAQPLSGVIGVGGMDTRPAYIGPTTVTPGDADIVLDTAGCAVPENIIVEKIPSNYGKIIVKGNELSII